MLVILSFMASIFDYCIVKRWNFRVGLLDKVFYLIGDIVLELMVGMMVFMLSMVLMLKMCLENMEVMMFVILASFNNFGYSFSSAFGVFVMDVVGIKIDFILGEGGVCDFLGLFSLVFYCGMFFLLVFIFFIFVFVSNINM